jgi:hypothetical protein
VHKQSSTKPSQPTEEQVEQNRRHPTQEYHDNSTATTYPMA